MNITENAPAVLLLNLAQGLTSEESKRLKELSSITPSNKAEAAKLQKESEYLIKKRSTPNETLGFSGWIPIPLIGSEILPFLPDSYTSTIMKRVETVGDSVVMSSTMSTSTINIKTRSNDLANTIINACHVLYAMDDSFARIAFFSPEMVVTSGVFLAMSRSINLGDTEEQIISIQVQNGTPNIDILKKLTSKSEDSIELLPITDEAIVS
ncbi:TPA: hypothetical protein ACMD15_003439 [Vibrio cholerae]